jgi:hypothetical protein
MENDCCFTSSGMLLSRMMTETRALDHIVASVLFTCMPVLVGSNIDAFQDARELFRLSSTKLMVQQEMH